MLHDSTTGYIKAKGGKIYENSVKNMLVSEFTTLLQDDFKKNKVSGSVVGAKTDSATKTQQKTDIRLEFDITNKKTNTKTTLDFSVKKSSSKSDIVIHHGGSVFAYAKRFSTMGINEFDFLQDGRFQYVFVNEFQKSNSSEEFRQALQQLITDFGFLFLGVEFRGISGADFLYVADKIYSFSSVLEKIRDNNEQYLSTVIKYRKEKLREEKLKYMSNHEGYYSESFINYSSELGMKEIYSIAFTIKMKKSALNI